MITSHNPESNDQPDKPEDRGDTTADQPRKAFALARFRWRRAEGYGRDDRPDHGKGDEQPVERSPKTAQTRSAFPTKRLCPI